PNVNLNEELTKKDLDAQLNDISYTKGIITQGSRIISKGEVIDANKLQILESLKKEYQSSPENTVNFYIVVTGYVLLIALAVFMFLLFIRQYTVHSFEDNKEVTFVFCNGFLVIVTTILLRRINLAYIY